MRKLLHQYFGGWRWIATLSLGFLAVCAAGALVLIGGALVRALMQ